MPEAFGLYLILTDPVAGYERCTEAAVAEGVRYLQLRMKERPRIQVVDTATTMRSITTGSHTLLIVNDDVHAAMEADADGVHLGQGDLSLQEARRIWGSPGRHYGLSTHDESQEAAARALAPDYIGVGPVFATPTKKVPDPVLGVDRAARIVRASPLTTVAIGGIDAERLPGLLQAGVTNFAVVRAVNLASDPREAIRSLMRVWRDNVQTRGARREEP